MKLTVKKLYSTYDVPYMLTDLTIYSMKELAKRMETDEELFDTFYLHNKLTPQPRPKCVG